MGNRAIGTTLFFGLFSLVLFATHGPFLQLPYFWDELGQFIPAALDIYSSLAWIPHSTLPNVHPPGVMAYLAGVWKLFGYSIVATRSAMLVAASLSCLAVFLLAIRLFRPLPGVPAFNAVLLLLVSPLFYAQSMMAQLDMPQIAFVALSILLFLDNRMLLSAIACTAAVLIKETAVVVPVALAAWLLYERRYRAAVFFALPLMALAGWLAYLAAGTGHLFGNREFTHYNLSFPLHPLRLGLSFVRRAYYLFLDNFHWVGTLILIAAWRHTRIFRNREWAVTGSVFTVYVGLAIVLGGAGLERYLLPVLPLFYLAVAAAAATLRPRVRHASLGLMAVGMIGSVFWNPPYPFPFENNLAVVDFVTLHQQAAQHVEHFYPAETIVSAWPFPDALRRPEFGYVNQPMRVRGIDNFNASTVLALDKKTLRVLVVYSRTWEPEWSVLRFGPVERFLRNYYFYEPQVTGGEIQDTLQFQQAARWERRGQWIEVWVAPDLLHLTASQGSVVGMQTSPVSAE